MQSQILGKNPSATLSVLVVWLPMLNGDSQQMIDQQVLADHRVTYFWDPGRVMGRWFSDHVTGDPGPTWDAFFLYGPQARWGTVPGPLIGSGSTVIGSRDELLAAFNRAEAATLRPTPPR